MKFSIIIPNLNSPTIHLTLEGLARQRDMNVEFEILVVGLDEPGLVRESPRIRFVSTGAPVFPAVARNIGLRLARGEIVCFLDADCVPQPDWLARIDRWFDDPAIAVLGGGIGTSETGFWTIADHLSTFHDYLATTAAGTREQLPSLNLIIRKSVLNQAGYFDESRPIGEDSDLTTRLRLRGFALHFDPCAVVNHMPNRRTARAVLRHAWRHGRYSIKVDSRWRTVLRPQLPFRHRALMLLTAPLLALVVTAGIYRADRAVWRWWYVAPAIFLLKFIWCLGAAEGMGHDSGVEAKQYTPRGPL